MFGHGSHSISWTDDPHKPNCWHNIYPSNHDAGRRRKLRIEGPGRVAWTMMNILSAFCVLPEFLYRPSLEESSSGWPQPGLRRDDRSGPSMPGKCLAHTDFYRLFLLRRHLPGKRKFDSRITAVRPFLKPFERSATRSKIRLNPALSAFSPVVAQVRAAAGSPFSQLLFAAREGAPARMRRTSRLPDRRQAYNIIWLWRRHLPCRSAFRSFTAVSIACVRSRDDIARARCRAVINIHGRRSS